MCDINSTYLIRLTRSWKNTRGWLCGGVRKFDRDRSELNCETVLPNEIGIVILDKTMIWCVNVSIIITFCFLRSVSSQFSRKPQSGNITTATVNCQGLALFNKRDDVLNYYKQKQYSIICFQDTHFIHENEPFIESQWGYKCVFNSYLSKSGGVCILFNNTFEFKILREKRTQMVTYLHWI